jgi:hypothetical protein
MFNEVYIVTTVFILFLLGISLWIGRKVYLNKRKEGIIKNFADYTAVLDYHMSKAYDMIHKDRMLIFSIEGSKLSDKEFNRFSKDFIRLVEKVLGKLLLEEFIFVYGDHETLTFVMAEYFSSKYETDEIRQSAVDDMMASDIEVPESLRADAPRR